ncbi:MAG: serine hydrolase [Reichenbachiella sp.]|uniref:serine hydrolase domain-containing protein n=1 Tax=Reichenbachiella sp. TaxID=2184521 RepID=UPI0032987E5B
MIKNFTILTLFLIFVSGCFYNDPVPSDQNVWPVALPSTFEMDEELLLEMDSVISIDPNNGISSVVIIKNGHLVYEKYYHGSDRRTLFELSGVSSSIVNVALGRAIDLGLITSVTDSIYKYLPEYNQIFEDTPLKKNITFEHVMTMKSGLSWSEFSGGFDDLLSDNDKIIQSEDWVEYLLSRPLDAYPGSRFAFNSAIAILISKVIEIQYEDSFSNFLTKEAFRDLNIDHVGIEVLGDNVNTAWGVSMTTLDLAKIGSVYLENGNWFGKPFIDETYVESSKSIQTNIDYSNDFGWMWWRYAEQNMFLSFLAENDIFFAAGTSNERMYIVPHLDLVVAITGTQEGEGFALSAPYVFRGYILGSLR